MAQRSRNWLLTINYKDEEPQSSDDLLEKILDIKGITYTVFQLEQGEQGTKHHQVYLSFKNAKSFDTIKRKFPSAHIESMNGTPKQITIALACNGFTHERGKIGKLISPSCN